MTRTVEVATSIRKTGRVRQVAGLFDVPLEDVSKSSWELPEELTELDPDTWNVGLIVGPSASGKSTIAGDLWPGKVHRLDPSEWPEDRAVVDAIDGPIKDVVQMLTSVGFGSPPAWLRPFHALSTGEQFRAFVARELLSYPFAVVDEFTSVVDRQVAQVASAAISKAVRAREQRLVAVTCHYDVIDWLQPDWVYRPDSNEFARRHLQRRPPVDLEVRGVSREAWSVFGPHHYLSADLHVAAKCVGAFVGDECVGFLAHYRFPHPRAKNIRVIHRLVVLPDYQGLGIGRALSEQVGQMLHQDGDRLRITTAHPAVIHGLRASPRWEESKNSNAPSRSKKPKRLVKQHASSRKLATRAFEYVPVG